MSTKHASTANTPSRFPTQKELIADLRLLAEDNPNAPVTRNFYRGNGKFKEAHWQKYFSSFSLFVLAAGLNPPAPVKSEPETVEVVGDRMSITLPKTRIQTLPELLAHCKVDLLEYEVTTFTVSKWEVGIAVGKDEGKHVVTEPLFQVKATLKRRAGIIDLRAEIESLKDSVKQVAIVPKPVLRNGEKSGNLYEIVLPDLHAGKLCYAKETGYQDYDTAIAVETYRRAIDTLIDRAKGYTFDRIVLGVGNDLLQSDNIQGTTYSGTKVDTDTRFHKTYRVVREMLTETIEKLRKIAPVDVKMIPGNHDTLSTFTLGDSLECRFHQYDDVTVDNAPTMHKTVEWGKVFLLLTHGHQGKQADYGVWMASQFPQEFSRTTHREVHVGHRHKSSLDEKFGIRVRTLSSLTPADAWHAQNNFVGNLRTAEGLVWNRESGLVAQFYHTEAE